MEELETLETVEETNELTEVTEEDEIEGASEVTDVTINVDNTELLQAISLQNELIAQQGQSIAQINAILVFLLAWLTIQAVYKLFKIFF